MSPEQASAVDLRSEVQMTRTCCGCHKPPQPLAQATKLMEDLSARQSQFSQLERHLATDDPHAATQDQRRATPIGGTLMTPPALAIVSAQALRRGAKIHTP